MAPIASLVVRVSAQISELQKSFTDSTKAVEGFKTSFEKQAASIQGAIDGVSKTFEQFGSAVGTIAVAAVGVTAGIAAIKVAFDGVAAVVTGTTQAVSDAVAHTVELGDSLFALSQKTGVSVENLSAFKFVAGQTGTSLESISGAVFKLEANLGKGGKATADALNAIGLSLKDLQAQNPADAFATILTKLGEIPNASDRAATGVALFGKSFKDIAQLSQEDLPALIQQAKDLGLVLTTETAVGADRLGDAMGALHGVFEGLQLQLGAKLMPALVAITETFGGVFIDAITAASKGSQGLGAVFDTLVVQIGQAIGRAIEVLAKMVDAVAAWAIETTTKVAAQARAFLDLAPAIIAVGRALDLALSGGTHQSGFDALTKQIEGLRAPLETVAAGAVAAGAKLREIAQGVAEGAKTAGENFGATYARIQAEIATAADKMRNSLTHAGDGGADSLGKVGKAAKQTATDLGGVRRDVEALNAAVQKFDTAAMQREFKELAREAKADIDSIDQRVQRFQRSTDDAAAKMQQQLFELNIPLTGGVGGGFGGIGFSQAQIQSFGLFGQQAAAKTTAPFKDAFMRLGQELPDLINRGFQQGGTFGAIVAVAEGASKQFAQVFKAGMDRTGDVFADLKVGEKFAAYGSVAAQSFATGFAQGLANPGAVGAISSIASGALAGAALGPVGAVVGGGVAAAGYLIGQFKNAQAEAAGVQLAVKNLLIQYHGLQGLTDAIARSGYRSPRGLSSGDLVKRLMNSTDAEAFNAALAEINTGLDQYNQKLKAIATSTDAVNRRTAAFANQFQGLDPTKRQETAQRTQPEFERISLFVRDTFAAIVKDSGDAIAAITALAPSFQVLKQGISEFGLESTAVIDALVGAFDLVNTEAFKPFFENIQATGQLLQGLFDAQALSPDTFQAAAADIGQSIQEIINRGGDMAKTLALSAPQLQLLWEAQQKYGAITDQTTQSILDQAVAQGVVGAQFKSVNEKILDVLLAIAEVLGADIPDALKGLGAAARSAADEVSDGLAQIEVPAITIPISFESDDPRVRFFGERPEPMAAGGVVTRPTLALVGESGPEAVIPLAQLGMPAPVNMGRGGDVYLDGRKVGKVMLRHVADEAYAQGLVPR